jgi:hypothetical protein
MRMTNAAVVATGALATLTAFTAAPVFADTVVPAVAAGPAASSAVSLMPDFTGRHRAAEQQPRTADELWAAKAPSNWPAPWDTHPAPLLSILDNAVINILPWQICGSTVSLPVSAAVPLQSPNTVLGDCNNANTTSVSN